MHRTVAEAVALAKDVAAGLDAASGGKVQVAGALRGTALEVAAQDVHWEAQGAFTGEVSAAMLADAGCRHGIVGHSERRQLFGETDEAVRKKVGALLAANVLPIVCVGETLQEREGGKTLAVVERQVRGALAGIPG